MDIDEQAGKLEVRKWNPEHTAFTATCPLNSAHVLAVSKAKTKCLGGCADALIAAFFANGTAPAKTNGHVPATIPDLTSWKLIAYDFAKDLIEKARKNAPGLLEGTKPQELVDSVVSDLQRACQARESRVLPLPTLSSSELDEEIYNIAAGAVGHFENSAPAITNGKPEQLPLVLPDLTKSKVEVYHWSEMRERRAAHVRDWAVEGMLARRETSSWSGKVEAGKTTLMRELTMAVIRGEPFLGRQTVKGRVFYAMLDADGEDVTYDEFAKLGFNDEDAQWCRFLFEPMMAQIEKGLEQFVKILTDFKPTLVIIDPYPRLKVIEDFHSYTNTYLMGMLSWMATMLDAHLALPGHIPRGRGDDDEVATAGFGSISFSGGVNARFVVTNRNGIHTVRSSKGKAAGFVPLEAEYTLLRDDATGRITMGDAFSWKDKGKAAADPVASFLAANNERCFDLGTLAREIHLQKSVVRTALGSLVYEGRIQRAGEGLKKSPFIYASKTYAGALTLAEALRE